MQSFQFEYEGLQVTYFIADDMVVEQEEGLKPDKDDDISPDDVDITFTASKAQELFRIYFQHICTGDFGSYMRVYAQQYGMHVACIHAHGGAEDGEWTLQDGESTILLQDEINQLDGYVGAIFVLSCNPGHLTPTSTKSLLIVPDRDVQGAGTMNLSGNVYTMIHPQNGEISAYVLEYELAQLQT